MFCSQLEIKGNISNPWVSIVFFDVFSYVSWSITRNSHFFRTFPGENPKARATDHRKLFLDTGRHAPWTGLRSRCGRWGGAVFISIRTVAVSKTLNKCGSHGKIWENVGKVLLFTMLLPMFWPPASINTWKVYFGISWVVDLPGILTWLWKVTIFKR